ncbi:hypothetical protein BDR07DRAFT_1415425 [Suillus spraguei]|nr:hypothetical protein BDR07DRAFT_1415425 [Suillus spraguei]
MPQRTHRQVQVQNLIMFAGKEKTSSNPPASPTEARNMSMSSDSNSPIIGSLSSTSESDTNEPSDDSSIYSDPSSLMQVNTLHRHNLARPSKFPLPTNLQLHLTASDMMAMGPACRLLLIGLGLAKELSTSSLVELPQLSTAHLSGKIPSEWRRQMSQH